MYDETDVAIVGAGPYALALAAQLRERRVELRIFGPPMKFWRDMPPGLNLKSLAFATSVYVPQHGHTFPEWCRAAGLEDHEPCTMESFAAYGMEMQRRFVPDLDTAEVTRVAGGDGRFELTTANGDRLRSRRVVLATGLTHFARLPDSLRGLPPELASHSSDHRTYVPFAGKSVAVIGAGASAVEAAVLVREAGGTSQVLARAEQVIFHDKTPRQRPWHQKLRAPDSSLGASRTSWLMDQVPLGVHFLPRERRVRFVRGYLGPSSPWWIKDRCKDLEIRKSTTVVGAERVGDRVRLRLRHTALGDQTLEVDHVIAGTGFDMDLDRVAYLDADLRGRIRRLAKAPDLSLNFESSVRGVYFLGPAAAMSFGPVLRFVAGARYAAPFLARHLAGPLREVRSALRRRSLSPA
jgi:cation diffusion facilitator CzcD-associated flavoprotein CzcO